jgi:hypothetical protein
MTSSCILDIFLVNSLAASILLDSQSLSRDDSLYLHRTVILRSMRLLCHCVWTQPMCHVPWLSSPFFGLLQPPIISNTQPFRNTVVSIGLYCIWLIPVPMLCLTHFITGVSDLRWSPSHTDLPWFIMTQSITDPLRTPKLRYLHYISANTLLSYKYEPCP